ncbi:hypothetical protein [Larkinella punicea]|uniref:Uncharacterized protein n=1 Tax=Larkinella punicea TaxID=2315727 RepID=A0A368JUD7_9BACT|nr:hypothetical protein [Larkinella punicea]RCR71268.1 hypothetical protein DUE52_03205 [Larkinella punicea]
MKPYVESHSEAYYLVHGPRNEKSNPANNLLRRIQKAHANTSLFPVVEVLRLSSKQQTILNYFDGTKNEVDISIKQLHRREELIDSFGQTKSTEAGGMV